MSGTTIKLVSEFVELVDVCGRCGGFVDVCDRCGGVLMVELLTPEVRDCCAENKGVELGLRGVVSIELGGVVEIGEVRLVESDLI